MEKRESRTENTKQKIIDAFLELLKEKKFSKITISDITRTACINRATFYYHFSDKYDVVEVIQQELLSKEIFREVKEQQAIGEDTIIKAFRAIVSTQLDLSKQCKHALEEFKGKMDDKIKRHLAEVLKELLDKERGIKEEHDLLATFWSWGIYGFAMMYVEGRIQKNEAENKLMNIFKE